MSKPIHVLLVDDEEAFCTSMSSQLTAEGFVVEVATSGPQALFRTQVCGGNYDVAVIDQVMGPPNGTEIMRNIHRLYPNIEVIILTGWGDMTPGQRAMELGAYRYMSKPRRSVDELVLNIRMAARFGQERQLRLSLQALVRAGQRISTAQSEEELYERLYQEVQALLPALDGFLITQHDEHTGMVSFPFCHVRGKRLSLPSRMDGNGIAEFVLQRKEPLLLPDGDWLFRQKHHLHDPDPKIGYCASKLVVPMFPEGRAVETLNAFTYNEDVRYTQEHLGVLQAFANQVIVAMRNVRQLEEARQLRDAVAALAVQRGGAAVRTAIVQEAHRLIDSDFTGLILHDQDGKLRKVWPVMPEDYFDRFDDPRQEEGLTRAVVNSRQAIVIPDTHQDPRVKEAVRQAGVRSMLVMPLSRGDRVVGVLYAHTFERRSFSQHHVSLWSAFATLAGVVLHSALEEEQEVENAQTLAVELGALTEKLPWPETAARVAGAAKAIFCADACCLVAVDPATSRLLDWTWSEGTPEAYRCAAGPDADEMTHYVLRTRRPVFRSTEIMEQEPLPHADLVVRGLRSIACMPLVYGGRVIGVLHCLYFKQVQLFGEPFKTRCEAFSARAAMALDRARRDHISEGWQELDRQMAACNDSRTLYRLLTEHALQLLHASFAVFYPYDTLPPPERERAILADSIQVGDLRTPWHTPEGGRGGGVHRVLDATLDGLLIANDLDGQEGRFHSRLSEREGVKAFVALRMDIAPEGRTEALKAGYLFLNYRQPTAFEPADLVGLKLAGSRVATAVQRLHLLAAAQEQRRQLNRRLRAVVDIFQAYRERRDVQSILERIAQAARDASSLEACSLLEYDADKDRFVRRGAAGLKWPDADYTLQHEFKTLFLDKAEPTVIPDVQQDARIQNSDFVQREGIKSVVIYPLCVENQTLGLLFANYRSPKDPNPGELEAIGLLADLAALVLYESRLQEALSETERRLQRRALLAWVSMVETGWRHAQITKAAALRNHTEVLRRRLKKHGQLPPEMAAVPETILEIDRLAEEIASAPPRVPQSWEMKSELIPLAALLQEVAQRESKALPSPAQPALEIQTQVEALGGVQVRGYRRWLIYALEALFQNARNAMPNGGKMAITASRAGRWVELRLRDSGPGVPEPIRGKLFRELIPKEQDELGMGIGSLLVATILEEHRGSIELERSSPGDTTVCIRLPVAEEEEKEEL